MNIFYIAGRTGGPFFPIPSLIKNLDFTTPIIIGVRNGFEAQVAQQKNLTIEYLPQTRLTILSFKKEKLSETIQNYLELFLNVFLFIYSLLKSWFLLLKYRPVAIYSTGSFLAVPVILVAKLTNRLRITNTKVIIHQQDPYPGLANRFTIKFADYKSCVFDYTREKFPAFKDCEVIPNPLDPDLYDFSEDEQFKKLSQIHQKLAEFIHKRKGKKPIMLIFGGGSGSEDLNVWTYKNQERLLKKFAVINLIGILQTKHIDQIEHPDYVRLTALFEEMPLVLGLVDVVLCRAGLGSITELLFLHKPAFLVPLPATHQEINAQAVNQYFYILDQKDRPTWMDTIDQIYPQFFQTVIYPERGLVDSTLANYYQHIRQLLDKSEQKRK